jgi:trigger factor
MREDIKKNLEREVTARTKAKTKDSVMNALIKASRAGSAQGADRPGRRAPVEMARQDMAQRGMDPKDMQLPRNCYAQAERRVRLGLIPTG